ncbi:MAG: hypothetical protein DRQ55_08540 [Planctomycetota bacterium]|nr:MAG: hypothetical protein DRQ55_08540 [Planctomycetota bacterium]
MFTQTWRTHWGLSTDPFACEDADKDSVLGRVDPAAVHSGFDRIFGDPASPAPGIVFGEKGSGKSGLRRMMRRRLAAHNEAQPNARVFVVEYVDFDGHIEALQRQLTGGKRRADADQALAAWRLSDHLDAILSLAVTGLVDGLLDGKLTLGPPAAKQLVDLHLATALYYRSRTRTPSEALIALARQLGAPGRGAGGSTIGVTLLSLLSLAVGVAPFVAPSIPELADWTFLTDNRGAFAGAGAGMLAGLWSQRAYARRKLRLSAIDATRALRVISGDHEPLLRVLSQMGAKERGELLLPHGGEEAVRFEYLQRVLSLLEASGHNGLYVLVDRVDEPTLLTDGGDRMREFVRSVLDIKLLQHPGLALKLFLPIEMESIWRAASAKQLKRMRLDKSNLVPELKWTGRELFEIANRRLAACTDETSRARSLSDLLGDDLPLEHVLESFNTLATPRYAFGFMSEVLLQHMKDLPEDLSAEDGRWHLSLAGFDVVRASWIDRAGVLRRTLN